MSIAIKSLLDICFIVECFDKTLNILKHFVLDHLQFFLRSEHDNTHSTEKWFLLSNMQFYDSNVPELMEVYFENG